LIRHANRLAIAGIIALGVALAVNLPFVTEYVFGPALAAVATVAVVGLIALLWFILPIWIRMTE